MGETASRRVFVSYRRADTRHVAGRLYDQLAARFGDANVFMDVDSIEPGLDFALAIEKAMGKCDVVLVLIGRAWLAATDEAGRRRIDDPEDLVVLEIRSALARDIRVVPVLVDGAAAPRRDDLPDVLAPLARRNAIRLDHETFRTDVGPILDFLGTSAPTRGTGIRDRLLRLRRRTLIAALIVATLLVIPVVTLWPSAVVPAVAGLDAAAASAILQKAGYRVVEASVADQTIPPGQAVQTLPLEATALPKGEVVQLLVSVGPCQGMCDVAVPDLVGLQESAATRALGGSRLGARMVRVRSDLPAGQVVATYPQGGARSRLGDEVMVIVSEGPPDATPTGPPPPAAPPSDGPPATSG